MRIYVVYTEGGAGYYANIADAYRQSTIQGQADVDEFDAIELVTMLDQQIGTLEHLLVKTLTWYTGGDHAGLVPHPAFTGDELCALSLVSSEASWDDVIAAIERNAAGL